MPRDVPRANLVECQAYGAHITLVDGLISDCARMIAERKEKEGWFEISTLKEPFRVEGKKTMGYEVAEQMGWKLPDAIIYPTGGGVGLIGMWKAFEEMEELGWIAAGTKASEDDRGAGGGCAPIQRHGGRQSSIRAVDERDDSRGRVARAQSICRLHHPRHPEKIWRDRGHSDRRRDLVGGSYMGF